MLCTLCGQLESLTYIHHRSTQPKMVLSMSTAPLDLPRPSVRASARPIPHSATKFLGFSMFAHLSILDALTQFKEVCFDTLRFKVLTWILLATPCLSVAADSYTYTFTTASLISGSLILVTAPAVGGISLVTSATGTVNSSAVTLISPGGFGGNDNLGEI